MSNDVDLDTWVRKHRKSFVRGLIRDAKVTKSDKLTAIFMAGLPGSGKTEFTKSLITILGIKVIRLDMDEIASQIDTYSPKKADKFRKAASTLLSCTYDKVIHDGYDFIMDGTFGGGIAIQNIERALKHGYDVKVFYIHQDSKVAWEYTKAREKVEHRAISREGFVASYYRTIENLMKVSDRFDDRISIDLVVKNDKNEVIKVIGSISMKDIDKYVKIEYNKDRLRKSIYE